MKGVTVLLLSFAFLALLSVAYGVQPRQLTTITVTGVSICTTYGTITACYAQSPTTWTNTMNITFSQSIPPTLPPEQPTVTTTELILIVVIVAALAIGVGYALSKRQR